MGGVEMVRPFGIGMDTQGIVLIAVSATDIASTNQADALMAYGDWEQLPDIEGHPAFRNLHCRIWILPGSILREDFLAKRWKQATGEQPSEVIFPSRHSAASGRPSLTLHPIGVMQLDSNEQPPFGGKAGDCPPPSTRLAAWWKELLRVSSTTEFDVEFDTSLEVTHHGPWVEVPALFIEVGSTQATWGHKGAAYCLAEIMYRGLGLDGSDGFGRWDPVGNDGDLVLITLGGGHYAPRANTLSQLDGVHLGHMLATYALPFTPALQEGDLPGGNWMQSIDAAFRSTRAAFPNGKIIFSMDKKAFKGWQRQAIRSHLESLGAPLLTSKRIRTLVDAD